MITARSEELFRQSRKVLAGGVSSMLRAACKPLPLFFGQASGSRLTDADGNTYIDYALAWGPMILGHSHPEVLAAVRRQLAQSQMLGAQHELEVRVASKLCAMIPCAGLVAFSNTGSEAVQVALRLARAFTGRRKVIKFEGHYHGWSDGVLLSYRPAAPLDPDYAPQLGTEGQSPSAAEDVFVLPWNDAGKVAALLEHFPEQIAAVITEPVLCNSSCLAPEPSYLQSLRELCNRHGALLIFDEVITGFRLARGGAQEAFGVIPDLATFGKAIAGGFPLSVVAGRADVMDLIPRKRVVHAGTFNGNPISLAAAEAVLDVLDRDEGAVLKQIRSTGETLISGLRELAANAGVPLCINGSGPVFHISFTDYTGMRDYRDTLHSDLQQRDRFLEAMLAHGIYLLPDGRWYLSAAHGEAEVRETLAAAEHCFRDLAGAQRKGSMPPRRG